MDATFYGDTNDTTGGRRYRRFIPFNFLLSLAAPHLYGVLVLVTHNKLSPVTTTPVINSSAVSTTLAITENPWQGLIAGVVDTAEQFITGVVDTGDKHSFANISANFRKNSKGPQWNTWGPGGHRFMKKHLKSKISCQTPFKYEQKISWKAKKMSGKG
jgi:hypothetical protein